MADQIEVRFADPTDLDGCIALDHPTMSAEVIKHKVEQREIIVAEKAGQLVGYLRLEYLWSIVPYIALIWVWKTNANKALAAPCCVIWKAPCANRGTRHCIALRRPTSQSRRHGTGTLVSKSVALSPA